MAKYLITGGAGFIGINFSDILLSRGDEVIVFDNFSRKGSLQNIQWLMRKHPNVRIEAGDIRLDTDRLLKLVAEVDVVHHHAAQVAVTTSVVDPNTDFDINALGTFNVLEAVRKAPNHPVLLYASTNKVYGGMEDVAIIEENGRYTYKNLTNGVNEARPIDFHSPYGCSKGAGDQYVRDYARIYNLRTGVMRQSCIYGRHQMGMEDQGWLAWFTIATLTGQKLTIYGDGKQIRDILFVEDLFQVWDLAAQNIEKGEGLILNIGGGPDNTLSLLELISMLENFTGEKINCFSDDWRPGDQRVYISDISKAREKLGWCPRINPQEGVEILYEWVMKNIDLFK